MAWINYKKAYDPENVDIKMSENVHDISRKRRHKKYRMELQNMSC